MAYTRISKEFGDRIKAVVTEVENISGPGVYRIPGKGISIRPPQLKRQPPPVFKESAVTVRVDSNRSGDAWYGGFIWLKPTGTVNTATSALESTVGTQGDAVSILNIQEVHGSSQTGHDLTHADNTHQRLFRGWFVPQVDEEGRRVVHINGLWLDACEEE